MAQESSFSKSGFFDWKVRIFQKVNLLPYLKNIFCIRSLFRVCKDNGCKEQSEKENTTKREEGHMAIHKNERNEGMEDCQRCAKKIYINLYSVVFLSLLQEKF